MDPFRFISHHMLPLGILASFLCANLSTNYFPVTGVGDDSCLITCRRIFLSISGIHCEGIHTIIFLRINNLDIARGDLVKRSHWSHFTALEQKRSSRAIAFPSLTSLTFVASTFLYDTNMWPAEPCFALRLLHLHVAIDRLRVEWTTADAKEEAALNLDPYLWPYPEAQRSWVAEHAPQLANQFRSLLATIGSDILRSAFLYIFPPFRLGSRVYSQKTCDCVFFTFPS